MNPEAVKAVEEFVRVLKERGVYIYAPWEAIRGFSDRKLDSVEFVGLPSLNCKKEWDAFSPSVKTVVQRFDNFASKKASTLPIVDMTNPVMWGLLFASFLPRKEGGYLCLSNGAIIEFASWEIIFGITYAPGGNVYVEPFSMKGRLLAFEALYSKTRVTRLMRLVREHLHKVRRESPVKIIDFAKQLDLLGL